MQIRTKQISDLLTTCVPITGSTLDVNLNGKILSNLLTPLLIGGTAVGSTLTYKTTTGIGTTDAHIFQVGNNGATEAMRILNSGNIGIGTASPVSLLNISNTPVGGTTGGNPTFTFLDTRNLNAAGWLANTTPLGTIQAYTTDASTTPNPIGSITFVAAQISGASPACDISFSTGSSGSLTEKMRILNTGNVGIGTIAPSEKFHLLDSRTTAGSAGIYLQKTGVIAGTSYGSYTETTGVSTTNIGGFFTASGATNNYGLIVPSTGGFTGLGTSAPISTLHVADAVTTHNQSAFRLRKTGVVIGTSYGLDLAVTGAGTNNICAYFSASGATNNYAIIVPSTGGNVGIGTITPDTKLHIVGTSGTTIKIVDGNQAVGRVLTCDATGVGSWAAASGGSGWSLTGNFSTLDATNFIGTSDNIPFNIRQNNLKAGRIDVVLAGNTFFGFQAGNLNSGNNFNTAIGQYAMRFNTSGQHNTAVGHLAMTNNTTGVHNTSVGVSALENNGTGSRNSSLGWQANRYQGNSDNTAFGYRAAGVGFSNTATQNTSIGSSALLNNEGNNNVAVGFQAASNVSTGQSNTIIGTNTGIGITTGNSNTVLGANVSGLSAALSNNIILADGGGTTRLQFSNTGALSLTGPAITVVAPTSPNRTLTVTVGGTVYYLHAKTTND